MQIRPQHKQYQILYNFLVLKNYSLISIKIYALMIVLFAYMEIHFQPGYGIL